jgi:hypothetical protein
MAKLKKLFFLRNSVNKGKNAVHSVIVDGNSNLKRQKKQKEIATYANGAGNGTTLFQKCKQLFESQYLL